MKSMFRDAASFAGKGLESFDTSKVKTTKQMFFGAASLVRNGMIGWNIESVEDMDYMFAGAFLFNNDLCSWRDQLPSTDKLTARRMFAGTHCLRWDGPDLDDLDTSPFCRPCPGSSPPPPAPVQVPLSDGYTGKAFASTAELRNAVDNYIMDESSTDLYGWPMGNWDVSKISDFRELFSASRNPAMLFFSQDLSNWDMSKATSTESMFEGTVAFTDSISSLAGWDVSKVRSMSRMFASSAFAGDISAWNVRSCRNFSFMFEFAAKFQGDLSGWETDKAADMGWMFRGCLSFNSPIPLFDVSGVTSMTNM